MEELQSKVKIIWKIITEAEDYILAKYPDILLDGHPTATWRLPKEITFKTSQELHDEFPDESIHGRENQAVEKYGAIFISKMGWPMADGSPAEEQRSPSYDDWNLNVSETIFLNDPPPFLQTRLYDESSHQPFLTNRETSWFVIP